MTERSDLLPTRRPGQPPRPRVSYTRRCGWVDWGHARPDGARGLIAQVDRGRSDDASLVRLPITLERQPAFALIYGQSMSGGGLRYPLYGDHYVVRRGLSGPVRAGAALGIFVAASLTFERTQSNFILPKAASSGFSAEDLVSNLIGFYAALRGYDDATLRAMCGEVSVKESLRIWDAHLPGGLGKLKNRSFTPIRFPTKEGVRSPADIVWPAQLSGVIASPPGRDWVRVRDGTIPSSLIARSIAVDVSSAGALRGPAYDRYLRDIAKRGPAY